MPNLPKNQKGFSLVEMLVYISILTLLLALVVSIIISLTSSQRSIKSQRSIDNSAIVGLERIVREIRLASQVNTSASIFDSSPGVLVLEGDDVDGNPRTVEFYISDGQVILRENGIDIGPVTQPEAVVTTLIFRLSTDPNSVGIRTELALESGTSTHYRSNNFYTFAVLR